VHLEIDRRDIRSTRVVDTSAPTELVEGQVVLKLERAALTSNNVSYALSGDMLDYWGFFPAESGWGRLPVMGFGVVSASKNADIAVGGRYFGFFPLGDHHVVNASSSRGGFVDAAQWREKHAMAYRSFDRADPTPHDDAILILRGLFFTSYLLEDFLRERENFGAEQVVITSASSKTSIALAHCVQRFSDLDVVGLTSSKNAAFTSSLGEYDSVITYDEVSAITNVPTIVVDMAGNPSRGRGSATEAGVLLRPVSTRQARQGVRSRRAQLAHQRSTRRFHREQHPLDDDSSHRRRKRDSRTLRRSRRRARRAERRQHRRSRLVRQRVRVLELVLQHRRE
jgi:Protein of unknown function (DUF2855)